MSIRFPGVMAVETSENNKIGGMSATYVTLRSCPECPFKDNGCYGQENFVGMHARRLDGDDVGDVREIARNEARAIDLLTGQNDLRLHVVGDCRTEKAVWYLNQAAQRYRRRGRYRRKVFTYTHAWQDVPRNAWGSVSVLASCESPEQVKQANRKGYAAALVVPHFEKESAYDYHGVRVIPCPYQTRAVKCVDCRLCMDDGRLKSSGLTIAFAAHGINAARVRHALPVIGGDHEG
jgi:hypothetical protein